MKNILEFLEANAKRFPSKTAFVDEREELTWGDLLDASKRIGSALSSLRVKNKPIAVYFDKSVKTLAAMFGIVYSGNFYVIIDSEMPTERIGKIFSTLEPEAIVTDSKYIESAAELGVEKIFSFNDLIKTAVDDAALSLIRSAQIDTDPLYALYTSGST